MLDIENEVRPCVFLPAHIGILPLGLRSGDKRTVEGFEKNTLGVACVSVADGKHGVLLVGDVSGCEVNLDGEKMSAVADILGIYAVRNFYPAASGHTKNAATVNGLVCDLRTPLDSDCKLELLTFDDPDGKHAFWHSASHVLAQAVKRLYPNAKCAIGPAIEGGFYYDFDVEKPFSAEDLQKIKAEMK